MEEQISVRRLVEFCLGELILFWHCASSLAVSASHTPFQRTRCDYGGAPCVCDELRVNGALSSDWGLSELHDWQSLFAGKYRNMEAEA